MKITVLSILAFLLSFSTFAQTKQVQTIGTPSNIILVRGELEVNDKVIFNNYKNNGSLDSLFTFDANGNGIFLKPNFEPTITATNSAKGYFTAYKTFATLNSDSLNEGVNNLFFTNTRARNAISVITTGSGGATYNNTTGVLDIPIYSPSLATTTTPGILYPSSDFTIDSAGKFSLVPLTKANVGLDQVDNTSDLNKPISTTTQAALDLKQNQLNGVGFLKFNGTTPSYDTTSYLSAAIAAATYQPLGSYQPQLNGTGFVKISGTTISYDNSTYITSAALSPYLLSSTAASTYQTKLGNGSVTNAMLAGGIDLTTKVTGLLPDSNISSAGTWNAKQEALVSGVNIRTINGQSLLGGGDIAITTTGGSVGNADSLGMEPAYYYVNITDTSNMLKPYTLLTKTKQDSIDLRAAIPTNVSQLANDAGYVTVSSEPVQSVAGKTGTVTLVKSDVGLDSVDNTSDLNKPISNATQTALNGKQATLVNQTNIKSINGQSLLGTGDLTLTLGTALNGTGYVKMNGTTVTYDNTTYEPAFTKNTAFNKNFGTSSGTVAQGNDSRIVNGQTAYGWGNHALAGYAFANNAALTGVPTAPTAVAGTNTTQIATTAFVTNAVAASTTGVSSVLGNTGAITLSQLKIGGLTVQTDFIDSLSALNSRKQNNISLTTTGTSGSATFINNVLNIPTITDHYVNLLSFTGNQLTLGLTNGASNVIGNISYLDNLTHLSIAGYVNSGYQSTLNSGSYQHIEGYKNTISGNYNHAEGDSNTVNSDYAHVEGTLNSALAVGSHAEGRLSKTNGQYSHASGLGVVTNAAYQQVFGKYNTTTNTTALMVIGNGTDSINRSDLISFNPTGVVLNGSMQATSFTGDGSALTNLTQANSSTYGVVKFGTVLGTVMDSKSILDSLTAINNKINTNNIKDTLDVTGSMHYDSISATHHILYADTANAVTTGWLTNTDWNTFNSKQATLVSGTNIKTINGQSLLGAGDISISGGSTYILPTASASILGGVKVGTTLNIDGSGVLNANTQTLQSITDNGASTNHKVTVANINVTTIPEYSSQTAAIAAGLSTGDIYKLPLSNGNRTLAIVDNSSTGFNYTLNDNDGSKNSYTFRIQNWSSTNFNVKVDWGDGTIDSTTYTGNYIYNPAHTYVPGTYVIKISTATMSVVNEFHFNVGSPAAKISNINNFNLFTGLRYADYSISSLTDVTNLLIPSTVTTAILSSNNLTTFNPTNALPASLDHFDISYNNLTTFSPSVGLPATITTLNLSYNSLTSTEVNNTLVWLDHLTFNSGAKTLDIRQSVAAPPSGTGLTAITSLQSKGWTITHD